MLYVIGGTSEQAAQYICENRVLKACVIDEPAKLVQLDKPDVVLVGTYHQRPNRQEFEIVLLLIGAITTFGA